jgi:hypothetical protein
MELKDFIGEHLLTGVDFETEKVKESWGDGYEDCNAVNFILDGKTYTAIEDPDDGYRSHMREIKESAAVVKNVFTPCRVLGKMKYDSDYEKNEVIEFIDLSTGKKVLSIGTENTDDYYPYWVAEFTPENMAVNAPKDFQI